MKRFPCQDLPLIFNDAIEMKILQVEDIWRDFLCSTRESTSDRAVENLRIVRRLSKRVRHRTFRLTDGIMKIFLSCAVFRKRAPRMCIGQYQRSKVWILDDKD